MKTKIEKLEVKPDPYSEDEWCWVNKSKKWYAPCDDTENKLDILRRTVNQLIDYIEKEN